jgi:hypothetical protein
MIKCWRARNVRHRLSSSNDVDRDSRRPRTRNTSCAAWLVRRALREPSSTASLRNASGFSREWSRSGSSGRLTQRQARDPSATAVSELAPQPDRGIASGQPDEETATVATQRRHITHTFARSSRPASSGRRCNLIRPTSSRHNPQRCRPDRAVALHVTFLARHESAQSATVAPDSYGRATRRGPLTPCMTFSRCHHA